MSYQKHNFQAGDVLFASQLNEMDNQIEISSRVTQIEPASNLPLMDNVATVGSSNKYAREDHVHPKDTTKLDTPTGGTVGQFIKKGSTGAEWSDVPVKSVNGQTGDVTVQPATDAQVKTAVDSWLDTNVAQETGYVLDRSLSLANAAAPADLVGDLKSAVNQEVYLLQENIGQVNYFKATDVSLVDVTGAGAYRVGCDCGELPPGNYILTYKQRAGSSSVLYLTTVVDNTYTQTQVTRNPFTLTLSASSKVLVSSNATSLSNWDFYDVKLIDADSENIADAVASLKEEIDDIASINQWCEISIKRAANGYIKATDGTVTAQTATDVFYTEYLDVSAYASIRYRMILTTTNVYNFTIGIAFYDENKTYLTGFKGRGGQSAVGYQDDVIDVPDGAVYVRFTGLTDIATHGEFYAFGLSKLYGVASLEEYFVVDKNLFDKSAAEAGKYVATNNGSINSYASTFVSDLIPIKRGNTYSYRVARALYGDTGAKRLALFDSNGVFVTYATGAFSPDNNNIVTVKISNNNDDYSIKNIPVYCRFTDYLNRMDTTMFVEGSYPSEYFTYGKDSLSENFGLNRRQAQEVQNITSSGVLYGKKIAYNGDSIAETRLQSTSAYNGGGYAKIIADLTGGTYANSSVSGGILASAVPSGTMPHSVVNTLNNMPDDADLICIEGGINDYWRDVPLGDYTESDYSGTLDTTTVCGALESIFRQATEKWVGKPICFVIVHKIKSTVYVANSAGWTFAQGREKMIGICKKYAIPFYDAFAESGLNAYNNIQNTNFLTSNSSGTPDGCHPNEAGYKKYYVPQLISLFEAIMPRN